MTIHPPNSITTRPAARRRRATVLVAVLLGAALTGMTGATRTDAETDQDVDEARAAAVEAGLLCNLFKYVEWPETAMGESGSPLTVGVIGDDPFGKVLDEIARGTPMRGRPIVVERFASIRDVPAGSVDPQLAVRLRACHMLFVCRSEQPVMRRVIELVEDAPVLTVSDIASFARDDGMIEFVIDRKSGRFVPHINRDRTSDAGLDISSKLLRLGKVVKSRRR